MSPKFRGSSDDWLDDSRSNKAGKKTAHPKKKAARAIDLPMDQSNAVVTEVFPNQCRVRLDSDFSELLCSYRRAGVVSGKNQTETRERTPVAVGDRVLIEGLNPQSGVVEGVCKRRNALYRLAPGKENEKTFHVLAANVDLLLIVASANQPLFTPSLVDRFLVAAELEKIPAALCITKMDLHSPGAEPLWKEYEKLNYPVFEVSVRNHIGMEKLSSVLHEKTVVFSGQSGVGKTSLLRDLIGKEIGRIGEVNAVTGKGRHTTTGAVLLKGPNDSQWIDTPGIKEFGLAKVTPETLGHLFPEFQNLGCGIAGCNHRQEPGCLARSLFRYSSYCRIYDSLISD